ncbi:MAG: hypothetical protein R3F20_11715 [Planctomycetota bacterium]
MAKGTGRSRPRKRIIVAGVLGVLLALTLIFVFRNVYDPFAEDVPDLKVFLPADLDWVIECEDLPTVLDELENSEFFAALDAHPGFREFMTSPTMRDLSALQRLRDGLRELHRLESSFELPVDVELIGDLSGRQLVLGGYAPEAGADPDAVPGFVAAIRPDSRWGQVFVNVLCHETLATTFISDRLPDAELRHRNWGVEIEFAAQGKPMVLGIARIESAILAGTDLDLLVRIAKQTRAEGVPLVAPSRYLDRWAWDEAAPGSSLRLLLSRRYAESEVSLLDRWLAPMWGPDMARVFEGLFPELNAGGADAISAEFDREARLRWESDATTRTSRSLFGAARDLDRPAIRRQIDEVLARLSSVVFGYGYIDAAPGQIVRRVLEDPRLVDADKRALWFEELAANVPRFARAAPAPGVAPDLVPDLREEFDRLFAPGVGMLLFQKERSDEEVDSGPGIAAVFRVRDRAAFDDFLAEISTALDGADMQAFDRVDWEDAVLWRITKTAFLDDPINNRPGFALVGEWLIVTNWFRLLGAMPSVAAGGVEAFGEGPRRELEDLLDRAEPTSRAFLYLDASRFHDFMEIAKEGWIRDRAEITEQEKGLEYRRLELEATKAGIAPIEREVWIDRAYERWKITMQRERNPDTIRREIDRTLGWFRGVFGRLFATVGRGEDRLRFELRLDAAGR